MSLALWAVECEGNCYALGRQQINRTQAAAYYQVGCDRGEPSACFALADAYFRASGVPNDHSYATEMRARGLTLFEDRCTSGNGSACAAVDAYRVDEDWEILFCEAEILASCARLAEDSVLYQEKACRLGDRRGCLLWERSLWEAALATEDRRQAADQYEHLVLLFPHSEHRPLALWNMANAQWDLGRIELALASWERFLKEYPSHEKAPQALVKIAQAHESLNQLEQAKAAREQLKISYPGYGASAPAE